MGTRPQRDPEEDIPVHEFADSACHLRPPPQHSEQNPLRPLGMNLTSIMRDATTVAAQSFAPFLNWSTFKIMEWQYSGSAKKSAGEVQRLVDNVLLQDEFCASDLEGFNIAREKRRLDEHSGTDRPFHAKDGWQEATVHLRMPREKHSLKSEDDAPVYPVSGIWRRDICSLIRDAYEDTIASRYHWFPFRLFRNRSTPAQPDAPPERLYSELYNSDAMRQEHDKLQDMPRNPDDSDDVEYVLAPMLVYSDSTHLTNFGTASLWPVYLWFGSLTKYIRVKPSALAAHHLAYIPTVRTRSCKRHYYN